METDEDDSAYPAPTMDCFLDGEEYLQSMVDEYTGPRQLQGWSGIIPDENSSYCGNGDATLQKIPDINMGSNNSNFNVQMNKIGDCNSNKKIRKAVPIQTDISTDNTPTLSPKGIVVSSPIFSNSKGKFNDQNFSLPALKI